MNQENFALPAAITDVLALLPPAPHSVLLAAGLNRVLGHSLQTEWLLPLREKSVCIRVTDAKLAFFLGADCEGLVARRYSQTPDVTIAACARDFLRLALREEDPDTLFFGRRLSMEGDTELGLLIKNILDAAEPSELLMPRLLPQRVRAILRNRLLA